MASILDFGDSTDTQKFADAYKALQKDYPKDYPTEAATAAAALEKILTSGRLGVFFSRLMGGTGTQLILKRNGVEEKVNYSGWFSNQMEPYRYDFMKAFAATTGSDFATRASQALKAIDMDKPPTPQPVRVTFRSDADIQEFLKRYENEIKNNGEARAATNAIQNATLSIQKDGEAPFDSSYFSAIDYVKDFGTVFAGITHPDRAERARLALEKISNARPLVLNTSPAPAPVSAPAASTPPTSAPAPGPATPEATATPASTPAPTPTLAPVADTPARLTVVRDDKEGTTYYNVTVPPGATVKYGQGGNLKTTHANLEITGSDDKPLPIIDERGETKSPLEDKTLTKIEKGRAYIEFNGLLKAGNFVWIKHDSGNYTLAVKDKPENQASLLPRMGGTPEENILSTLPPPAAPPLAEDLKPPVTPAAATPAPATAPKPEPEKAPPPPPPFQLQVSRENGDKGPFTRYRFVPPNPAAKADPRPDLDLDKDPKKDSKDTVIFFADENGRPRAVAGTAGTITSPAVKGLDLSAAADGKIVLKLNPLADVKAVQDKATGVYTVDVQDKLLEPPPEEKVKPIVPTDPTEVGARVHEQVKTFAKSVIDRQVLAGRLPQPLSPNETAPGVLESQGSLQRVGGGSVSYTFREPAKPGETGKPAFSIAFTGETMIGPEADKTVTTQGIMLRSLATPRGKVEGKEQKDTGRLPPTPEQLGMIRAVLKEAGVAPEDIASLKEGALLNANFKIPAKPQAAAAPAAPLNTAPVKLATQTAASQTTAPVAKSDTPVVTIERTKTPTGEQIRFVQPPKTTAIPHRSESDNLSLRFEDFKGKPVPVQAEDGTLKQSVDLKFGASEPRLNLENDLTTVDVKAAPGAPATVISGPAVASATPAPQATRAVTPAKPSISAPPAASVPPAVKAPPATQAPPAAPASGGTAAYGDVLKQYYNKAKAGNPFGMTKVAGKVNGTDEAAHLAAATRLAQQNLGKDGKDKDFAHLAQDDAVTALVAHRLGKKNADELINLVKTGQIDDNRLARLQKTLAFEYQDGGFMQSLGFTPDDKAKKGENHRAALAHLKKIDGKEAAGKFLGHMAQQVASAAEKPATESTPDEPTRKIVSAPSAEARV